MKQKCDLNVEKTKKKLNKLRKAERLPLKEDEASIMPAAKYVT